MIRTPNQLTTQLALSSVLALGALGSYEMTSADRPNMVISNTFESNPNIFLLSDSTSSDTSTATINPSDTATSTITITSPLNPTKLPSAVTIPRQQYRAKYTIDGHSMDVFVPGQTAPKALVLIQHRLYGSPAEAEATTKLVAEASKHKWLIAFPGGYQSSWNADKCCGMAKNTGQPDVEFLADTIRFLRHKYHLSRTAPTIDGGISNGAMLAARFYCKHPEMVDAAILDSGNLEDPSCTSARVKNLLMMRGRADDLVYVTGNPYSQLLHTSLFADSFTFDAFERGSNCEQFSDNNTGGVETRLTRCGARVMRYVLGAGDHRWQNTARPGIPNETKLATDFIIGVTMDKMRNQTKS